VGDVAGGKGGGLAALEGVRFYNINYFCSVLSANNIFLIFFSQNVEKNMSSGN